VHPHLRRAVKAEENSRFGSCRDRMRIITSDEAPAQLGRPSRTGVRKMGLVPRQRVNSGLEFRLQAGEAG
jgi:hypothetical protein